RLNAGRATCAEERRGPGLGNSVQEEIVKKNKKLKAKTHRGAAKRFKITSTGKVMRWRSGKRHLLGTKKPRRMRRLLNKVQVSPADVKNVRLALPYGLEKVFSAPAERNGCLPTGCFPRPLFWGCGEAQE